MTTTKTDLVRIQNWSTRSGRDATTPRIHHRATINALSISTSSFDVNNMPRYRPPPPPPAQVRLGGIVRYDKMPVRGIRRYLWKKGCVLSRSSCAWSG